MEYMIYIYDINGDDDESVKSKPTSSIVLDTIII